MEEKCKTIWEVMHTMMCNEPHDYCQITSHCCIFFLMFSRTRQPYFLCVGEIRKAYFLRRNRICPLKFFSIEDKCYYFDYYLKSVS